MKIKIILIITTIVILSLVIFGRLAMFFLFGKIENVEPKIVTLKEPIKFVGLSIKTSTKKIYKDVPKLGKEFNRIKELRKISNKKEPWAFVAVSKDYNKNTATFDYIIGDVVTSFDSIPDGLQPYEIPAITYAVFPIRPKNRFVWGLTIGKTKQYIYKKWIPNSKYEPAGIIDDFEYHDERSLGKNPSIELYVAIKEK